MPKTHTATYYSVVDKNRDNYGDYDTFRKARKLCDKLNRSKNPFTVNGKVYVALTTHTETILY